MFYTKNKEMRNYQKIRIARKNFIYGFFLGIVFMYFFMYFLV